MCERVVDYDGWDLGPSDAPPTTPPPRKRRRKLPPVSAADDAEEYGDAPPLPTPLQPVGGPARTGTDDEWRALRARGEFVPPLAGGLVYTPASQTTVLWQYLHARDPALVRTHIDKLAQYLQSVPEYAGADMALVHDTLRYMRELPCERYAETVGARLYMVLMFVCEIAIARYAMKPPAADAKPMETTKATRCYAGIRNAFEQLFAGTAEVPDMHALFTLCCRFNDS